MSFVGIKILHYLSLGKYSQKKKLALRLGPVTKFRVFLKDIFGDIPKALSIKGLLDTSEDVPAERLLQINFDSSPLFTPVRRSKQARC